MIIFKDDSCKDYNFLTYKVSVISNETCYGIITYVQLYDDVFYFMGNENQSLMTAIFAWQEYHKKDLSDEELQLIMSQNNLNVAR